MRTLLLLVISCAAVSARADQDGGVLAPIVRTEHTGGGIVRVVYDLSGAAGTLFAVSLEASNDGGRTYAIHPVAVTGDVGPGVFNRGEKTIVWDSSKDVEDLQLDRYVFRVRVLPSGPAAATAAPAGRGATAPADAGRGADSRGRGGPTTGAKNSGGLSKGAIMALAGGGVAAGVGVAAAKGSGGGTASSPSTGAPTTTPPAGPRTFNGTFAASLVVRFTSPQTGAVCTRTDTLNGGVRLDLQVGTDGTSITGTGIVTGSSVIASTNCAATAEPVGFRNVYFGMSQPVAASGTTGAVTFRLATTGSDTTTTEYTFSGSLTGDIVSGTLTFPLTREASGALGTVQIPISAR